MFDFLKKLILLMGVTMVGVSAGNAFTFAWGTNRVVANNIGEEYRWNTPLLTYAYDESFLNYFGSNGVVAIEHAIRMMNAIPPVSTIKTNYPPVDRKAVNLWNFPTRPDRYHGRAASARLLDMKSHALAELFSYMGLGMQRIMRFSMNSVRSVCATLIQSAGCQANTLMAACFRLCFKQEACSHSQLIS